MYPGVQHAGAALDPPPSGEIDRSPLAAKIGTDCMLTEKYKGATQRCPFCYAIDPSHRVSGEATLLKCRNCRRQVGSNYCPLKHPTGLYWPQPKCRFHDCAS